MEFAAIGAFVALFIAFVVLPKRLIKHDDEPTFPGPVDAAPTNRLEVEPDAMTVLHLAPSEHEVGWPVPMNVD